MDAGRRHHAGYPDAVWAQFQDDAGNWSVRVADAIYLDPVPPTISQVASSSVTETTARITWLTNEACGVKDAVLERALRQNRE